MTELVLTNISLDQIQEIIQQAVAEGFSSALKAKQPPSESQAYLTRKEVQTNYKISLGTIHRLMRSGQLRFIKVGRKTLFRVEDVESVLSG